MNSENLHAHEAKKKFKGIFRSINTEEQNDIYAEAAFPAYAHGNPFIDRLFWGRLSVVEKYIHNQKIGLILDYGCGSGVMSWILSFTAQHIYMTDIEPVMFERMSARVQFPENVTFVKMKDLEMQGDEFGIQTIIALDVLEHVEDLRGTLEFFKKLTHGCGEVIISGPTENILYKAGRLIAGKRFTGHYHRTDISHIKNVCREFGAIVEIKKLYPFIPFFDIFSLKFT